MAPHHTGTKLVHVHPQPSPGLGAHVCASSRPLPLTLCAEHRAEQALGRRGAHLPHQLFEGRSFTGT